MIDNIRSYFSHTLGSESNLSFFGKVIASPFVLFLGIFGLIVYLLVLAMESKGET